MICFRLFFYVLFTSRTTRTVKWRWILILVTRCATTVRLLRRRLLSGPRSMPVHLFLGTNNRHSFEFFSDCFSLPFFSARCSFSRSMIAFSFGELRYDTRSEQTLGEEVVNRRMDITKGAGLIVFPSISSLRACLQAFKSFRSW